MKTLLAMFAMVGLFGTGCTHETLLSELGTDGARPAAAVPAWAQPASPGELADGAACVYGTECRSGYCSESRCEHTDVEDTFTAAVAAAR